VLDVDDFVAVVIDVDVVEPISVAWYCIYKFLYEYLLVADVEDDEVEVDVDEDDEVDVVVAEVVVVAPILFK
jgi:hypothetical protein